MHRTYVSKPLNLQRSRAMAPGRSRPTTTRTAGTMDLVRAVSSRTTRSTRSSTSTSAPRRSADREGHGDHLQARGRALGGVPAASARACRRLTVARAYATLANGGVRHKPIAIRNFCASKTGTTRSGPARASACSRTGSRTRLRRSSSRRRQGYRTKAPGRLPRRRQDRHDRQLQRRLVRRLHTRPGGGGLGRLPRMRCARCAARTRINVAGGCIPALAPPGVHAVIAAASRSRRPRRSFSPFYGKNARRGQPRSGDQDEGLGPVAAARRAAVAELGGRRRLSRLRPAPYAEPPQVPPEPRRRWRRPRRRRRRRRR